MHTGREGNLTKTLDKLKTLDRMKTLRNEHVKNSQDNFHYKFKMILNKKLITKKDDVIVELPKAQMNCEPSTDHIYKDMPPQNHNTYMSMEEQNHKMS